MSGNGFSGNDADDIFRGGWGKFVTGKILLIPLCQKLLMRISALVWF